MARTLPHIALCVADKTTTVWKSKVSNLSVCMCIYMYVCMYIYTYMYYHTTSKYWYGDVMVRYEKIYWPSCRARTFPFIMFRFFSRSMTPQFELATSSPRFAGSATLQKNQPGMIQVYNTKKDAPRTAQIVHIVRLASR